MHIERYIVGPLQTNCYQVIDQAREQSVIVDPGGINGPLMDAVRRYPVTAILLTHGHFDHTAGIEAIVAESGAPVYIHPADRVMFDDPTLNGSFLMGTELRISIEPEPIEPDSEITIGNSVLTLIETPGHSRGGLTFLSDDGFVLAGDTLFRLSVGRWDLPGGDVKALMASVRTLIDMLPPETTVYPGHGEPTTIGYERDHNEFIRSAWQ